MLAARTVAPALRRRTTRALAGALAALVLSAGCSAGDPATEAEPGVPIPAERIGIQLYTFSSYVGPDARPGARERQEEVLRRVAEIGYAQVEPVDDTDFQGLGAAGFRDLLDEYGLTASSLHASVSSTTTDEEWAEVLDVAETLGAPVVGSGITRPELRSVDEWIAYAERIDHLGELARERGMRYLVHTHDWELTTSYDGRTPLDLLMEHTDAADVAFELDVYWAARAGADPVELLREHPDRIELLHLKDAARDGSITAPGDGTLDLAAVLAAAGPDLEAYVVERDPPGDDRAFDPFDEAARGFAYLSAARV